MVTRRFWPHADDSACRLASWADQLRALGARITFLTPRYAASWPTELTFREHRVIRPVVAPRGDWSAALYSRALHKWLREHAAEYALLYGDNLREEGAAVVDAARRSSRPAVVRCGGAGAKADVDYAGQGRNARRAFRESLGADLLLAPDADAARAAIASGAERQRVKRISDGFPPPVRRDARRRGAARAALAAINHDLWVDEQSCVALICGAMETHSGMIEVAEALAPLSQGPFDLRLWFVGDGPGRESLHRKLCDLGVRQRSAMPGWFGDFEELYQAADLYIACGESDGWEHRLPAAVAAGLPTVVLDCAASRGRFATAHEGWHWYHAERRGELAEVVLDLVRNWEHAAATAKSLQRQVLAAESRQQQAAQLWRWLVALVPSTPLRKTPPREAAS
jgi:hypothetical protein